MALTWYATLGRKLFGVWNSLDTMLPFAVRGFEGVDPGPAWYVITSPGAISLPLAILGLFGLLRGLFGRDTLPRILALSFVCAYIGVLQQPSRAWWYFAAALPFVAVLSAISLADLLPTRIYRVSAGATAALAIFCWGTVTWGTTTWTEPIARALGAPINTPTCFMQSNMAFCPHPPTEIDWQGPRIAREVLRYPDCRLRTCTVLIRNPARYSPTFVANAIVEEWPDGEIRVAVAHPHASVRLGTSDFLLLVDRVPSVVAASAWPGFADFASEYLAESEIGAEAFLEENPSLTRLFREGPSFRLPSGNKVHLFVTKRLAELLPEPASR